MGFICAICRVCFEQFHVRFSPKDPFLIGLWAKCLDCSGYVVGYASKRKYLVVCGQYNLVNGGGEGSP